MSKTGVLERLVTPLCWVGLGTRDLPDFLVSVPVLKGEFGRSEKGKGNHCSYKSTGDGVKFPLSSVVLPIYRKGTVQWSLVSLGTRTVTPS